MNYFSIKNNKIFVLKKLVFILILFAFFNSKVYATTISFESHGGPNVASYDISTDTLGTLPSPTMDGYLLDGWYKEDTYLNKVSSNTVVTGDMTLHAKWILNPFPYVYPYHEADFVCTGSNYIDTGVKLYTGDTYDGDTLIEEGTWSKDYEIGFTIEEYDPNIQTADQAVFMNTKYESQAAGWPGLVVRKAAQKIEITQTVNSGKAQRYINDLTFPMQIKIIRKNNTVYYQVNGGTLFTVQSMGNFTKFFDIPVYFCAGDNGNGGVQRNLIGTISNYYIRMGNYENTTEHSVTYPDGFVEIHGDKEVIDIGSNEGEKPSENVSKVTFDYNDGVTPDLEKYVTRVYTPNGYMIDGVHYDDGAPLVVDDDRVITNSFTDAIEGVEFPSNPTRSHYIFAGWYDDPDNGNLVENYDGVNNITLYAHWNMNLPEDATIDDDNLTMVVGDVHQVGITYTPDDSFDNAIYSGYDSNVISVVDGTITALAKGNTTITVSFEHVPGLTKTITVSVLSDVIESSTYEVRPASGNKDRIIIGLEPGSTVGEFKDELLNPNMYIEVYDSSNNLVLDSDIVKTGLTVKLVYGSLVKDEAILVVRGDTSGDGIVNVTDYLSVLDETLGNIEITEYPSFAAGDVVEDDMLRAPDATKIKEFIGEILGNLNE